MYFNISNTVPGFRSKTKFFLAERNFIFWLACQLGIVVQNNKYSSTNVDEYLLF